MAEKFTDTPLLTSDFDRAMQLALDHHRMHLRKATKIPYVSHLLAVTAIVLELGGSEDEAIAALLHDAVEDGGGPMMQKRIAWEFGEDVGTMVAENSDSDAPVKGDWAERKAAYIAGMKHKSAGGLRVSLADKLHNARAIVRDLEIRGDEVWQRFSETNPVDQVRYYHSLARRFRDRSKNSRLLEEFEQAVERMREEAGVPRKDAKANL